MRTYDSDAYTRYNLKLLIREGSEPDSAELLSQYFYLTEEAARQTTSHSQRVSIYLNCAWLFLNTAQDQHLPTHWRRQCIDQIYSPLLAAQRYATCEADDRKVRLFQYQYTTLICNPC